MVESGWLPGPVKTDGLWLRLILRTPDEQLHVVSVRHLRDCGYLSCVVAIERFVLAYGAGTVDAFSSHGVGGPVPLVT